MSPSSSSAVQVNDTVSPGDTVVLSAVRLVIRGSVLRSHVQLINKPANMTKTVFIFTRLILCCGLKFMVINYMLCNNLFTIKGVENYNSLILY